MCVCVFNRVKALLGEAQGLAKDEQHVLPWYPPICGGLSDIPEGPRSCDHIKSVRERSEIPLKMFDVSMKEVISHTPSFKLIKFNITRANIPDPLASRRSEGLDC